MLITCESQISEVTVYARGAIVRRRLQLPAGLPDGEVNLHVAGVTPLLLAASLRARLVGAGRNIVAVRSVLQVQEAAPVAGPSVKEVRAIVAQIERLKMEQAHLAARRERILEQALDPVLRPQSALERLDRRVGDALGCLGQLQEIAAELDGRLREIGERLRVLEEERETAALRSMQATSASRMGAGHPRRDLYVCVNGSGPIQEIELSYVVHSARFFPVYTLHLRDGGRHAELSLEALVAQLSGEDWCGVRLSLSTADLFYDARLPELSSLRFGRAQAAARRAYRPPPDGLDRMFAGYDRVFGTGVPASGAILADAAFEEEATAVRTRRDDSDDFDGEDTGSYAILGSREAALDQDEAPGRSARARSGAPAPKMRAPAAPKAAIMIQPFAMSVAAPAPSRAHGAFGGASEGFADAAEGLGGGGGFANEGAPKGGPAPRPEPPVLEPDDAWLDFDALRLHAATAPQRGRLQRERGDKETAQRAAAARIEQIAPAIAGAQDPRVSRGRFDHRYDAQGRADVPSDGLCHRVTLGAAAARATLRFRTVPREVEEVYREVELQNPFPAPLLSGPVDVYVEGSLLLQTTLLPIDRGGTFTVGMGVEERLRVARNARSEEESAGLIGGSTAVTHSVTLELSSSLSREVIVEVLDRIPVTDDKSIEVKRVSMKPEGEPYKQVDRGQPVRGGWLWRLCVPPSKKAQIEFVYRVILPAKSEIIGGNRRE